jgi:hypothetical protein
MLDRANEKGMKLNFVSGGEVSLFYCHESVSDLKEAIGKRQKAFSGVLAAYPNLFLGGTLALWERQELKKDWLLKKKCGSSGFKGIDDFGPAVRYMLQSYDYVWIYAAMSADYNPYEEAKSRKINLFLKNLINRAGRAGQNE